MSLNVSGVVDSSGNATLTIKNDAPLKGFRIDALNILVPNESLPGTCQVYRGLKSDDTLLTVSGFASDDQASGPYWLAAGGILTLEFSGLTPGNIVQVTTSGFSVPNQDTFQLGSLRFRKPARGDVVPQAVYQLQSSDTDYSGPSIFDSIALSSVEPWFTRYEVSVRITTGGDHLICEVYTPLFVSQPRNFYRRNCIAGEVFQIPPIVLDYQDPTVWRIYGENGVLRFTAVKIATSQPYGIF